MIDFETPCACQRCGWLGKYHDAHELQTDPVQYVCPRCTVETPVQTLGQKGLDGLRQEYELMYKLSYRTELSLQDKADRREYLERFFDHIGQRIRNYDAEAIYRYSLEHADDPTPREGLGS